MATLCAIAGCAAGGLLHMLSGYGSATNVRNHTPMPSATLKNPIFKSCVERFCLAARHYPQPLDNAINEIATQLLTIEHWAWYVQQDFNDELSFHDLDLLQEAANKAAAKTQAFTKIICEPEYVHLTTDIDSAASTVQKEIARLTKAVEGRLGNQITRSWALAERGNGQ